MSLCDSPRVYVLLTAATARVMRAWRDLYHDATPDAMSAILDTFSWPSWEASEALEVACVMDAPVIEFCRDGYVHAIHPADDEAYYLDSPCHPDVYAGSPVPADDLWAAEAFFRYAHGIDPDD